MPPVCQCIALLFTAALHAHARLQPGETLPISVSSAGLDARAAVIVMQAVKVQSLQQLWGDPLLVRPVCTDSLRCLLLRICCLSSTVCWVHLLQNISKGGRTIVVTIHQPSIGGPLATLAFSVLFGRRQGCAFAHNCSHSPLYSTHCGRVHGKQIMFANKGVWMFLLQRSSRPSTPWSCSRLAAG